ncbi:MAG: sulfite exporter TauE/SafE family protein [Bacteroidia bacterium]|jgi:uncharacterized membrane protein YfcA
MQNLALIALIGILAGLFGGMFGLGGAVIIIPAMVMLLGYSQQMAQGTTLAMMVLPVSALAAFQYYKNGYVDIKVALVIAVFFMVGGFFGAKLATLIPQEILKKAFAIMLILIAVKTLFFDKNV